MLSEEASVCDTEREQDKMQEERYTELQQKLINCESGDMSRIESVEGQMAKESMLDMENYDIIVAK